MKSGKKTFSMNDDYQIAEEILSPPSTENLEEATPPGLPGQTDMVMRELSGARPSGQVYLIEARQLEPFPNQPFKPYTPDKLQELADDISRVGILNPILARRKGGKLQTLAGHNRIAAARLAGLAHVPVLIVEADDEQAQLVVTSTNLRQRERLLPSEKAFAYKMQMDALKKQGQKGNMAYDASSFITRQTGDSRMQIHRYTRLTGLDPGLLELLDKGKIGMGPAVSASYLDAEIQQEVLNCIREHGAKLSLTKGNEIKTLADSGSADRGEVRRVMLGHAPENIEKKQNTITISLKKIKSLIPPGTGHNDIEGWIIEALKNAAVKTK